MTHCSIPAWHKGLNHKGPTIEGKRWKGLECNKGIKDRGARWQLRLGKERASDRIFIIIVELEIRRQAVEFSIQLRKSETLDTVGGDSSHPNGKEG
jgi:hypothetical protein